ALPEFSGRSLSVYLLAVTRQHGADEVLQDARLELPVFVRHLVYVPSRLGITQAGLCTRSRDDIEGRPKTGTGLREAVRSESRLVRLQLGLGRLHLGRVGSTHHVQDKIARG